MTKNGLVLEGGGLRDLFTAGILDVMMEHDIHFDGIIGVSAGATFGCNYKSHQPGRCLRYNKNMAHDWRFCSIRSLIKTGDLVGADFAYHVLPTEIDVFDNETFKKDPTEFCVVCTDTETGKPIYHRVDTFDYEGLEWLRATASLPIVSRAVHIGGHTMLDGGISDSIPLKYWQSKGYQRNIVILTQPDGFEKKKTRLMPFFKIFCRRYPAIIKAMGRRHIMYNEQLAYLREEKKHGSTLVLCPDNTIDIGRTEMKPDKMQQVYNQGRKYGNEHIDEVLRFLRRE